MPTSEPHPYPLPYEHHHIDEGVVLVLDKPPLWTSFDIIKKLRSLLSVKKIGHAGTLDPLATGVLLVCTGKKTKDISCYQDLEKVYIGEMILGKTTPSIDLETDFDSETSYTGLTELEIRELAPTFLGYISQVPPAYSAIKTCGVRAYKKARQGQPIILAPRRVFIRSFVITSIEIPSIKFEVTCGKGTYIRGLVRDFGLQLGVGAYLKSLCRTRIGPFRLEDAYDMEELVRAST
ncbi:MAG: tRNA pseudouridine(55) synthase TruB [Amoebophilaceae bacterium]|jgi:tRNA pseudouridine55 synthase|nr:tRNA pseudouridine(55) synthase TruB [Amoebophilaceae bacterium]